MITSKMLSRDSIVQSIDEEIDRLQRARALLTGHTAPLTPGLPRTANPFALPREARHPHQPERKQRRLAKYAARWKKPKK
jgi:hypothetical protein